jgi:hypothetical protein
VGVLTPRAYRAFVSGMNSRLPGPVELPMRSGTGNSRGANGPKVEGVSFAKVPDLKSLIVKVGRDGKIMGTALSTIRVNATAYP